MQCWYNLCFNLCFFMFICQLCVFYLYFMYVGADICFCDNVSKCGLINTSWLDLTWLDSSKKGRPLWPVMMDDSAPMHERRKLVKTYRNVLPPKRIVVAKVCGETYSNKRATPKWVTKSCDNRFDEICGWNNLRDMTSSSVFTHFCENLTLTCDLDLWSRSSALGSLNAPYWVVS